MFGQGPAEPHAPVFERLPIEQLRDKKQRTVVRDIIVEYSDRAVVADRVGQVALPLEAASELSVNGELGVQDFDCGSASVPVGGCIDAGHAPRAEQHIQAPLAVQGRPHAHLGTQQEGINGLRGVVVFVEFHAPPPLRGASGSTRGASEDQDS